MKTILITIAIILISFSVNAGVLVEIKTGETKNISDGNFSSEVFRITYCGMVSDRVFSIKSSQYRSSVNLYYSTKKKFIEHKGVRIEIIKIEPDKLTIEPR